MSTPKSVFAVLIVLLAASGLISSANQVNAQDYQEWSAETRTSFSFRVNGDSVRNLLPAGWTIAAAEGAADQVNLTVTFMDRHVVLDPQGEPVGSGSTRYMVMSVSASNALGVPGILIINGISPEGAGAYGVYQSADIAMAERLMSGHSNGLARAQESWQMVAAGGDRVSVTLHYQQAVPVRRQSTIVIRSGKHTDYTRTYNIDQASDALGLPGDAGSRIGTFSFEASGPLFSRLFDGSEELLGITSTPWYHREISVP